MVITAVVNEDRDNVALNTEVWASSTVNDPVHIPSRAVDDSDEAWISNPGIILFLIIKGFPKV